MSKAKDPNKCKKSKLVITLYVAAVLMAAMLLYTIITTVMYINSYAASYGVTMSAMMGQAIQTILSSAAPYLAYGLALLGIGKILDTVQQKEVIEKETEYELIALEEAIEDVEKADEEEAAEEALKEESEEK